MPVLYRIDPSLNLLYYAAFGTCTGVDFFQAERSAFQHELQSLGMQVIVDVRTAEVDFGTRDIRQAIALIKERRQQNYKFEKTAVLSLSSFAETFVKAYGVMSDSVVEIQIFRSTEEAVKWLGLSDFSAQILQIENSLNAEFQKPNPAIHPPRSTA